MKRSIILVICTVCTLGFNQAHTQIRRSLPEAITPRPDNPVLASTPQQPTRLPTISIYETPYSFTKSYPDWRRLWINTATLCGAYLGSFAVLCALPEDATSWNRKAIISVPPLKRWWRNNFELGPEWDHDNPIFNYVLHPYSGAAYFMAARSAGFNFYQSLLYCACISTICWEFGVEAFMERPSLQDLIITPVVGSAIGECFYLLKRRIVDNGYTLWGSSVIGNIIVWLIDPVNEFTGLFLGNPARRLSRQRASAADSGISFNSAPWISAGGTYGFKISCRF